MTAIPKLRPTVTAKLLSPVAALSLLDKVLCSFTSSSCDSVSLPLLVSIDVEYNKKFISEFGISIFDPEDLPLPQKGDAQRPREDFIHTNHYAKGGPRARSKHKLFRFGETQSLLKSGVRSLLEGFLNPVDPSGQPRDVVLVGHSIMTDATMIKVHCGFDISEFEGTKAILDTQSIGHKVLNTKDPRSLQYLLDRMGLEYMGLHNAAHDARYTLRVLIMLFCHSRRSRATMTNDDMRIRLGDLESIARLHKMKERRTWCESKRIKSVGKPDLFDEDLGEDANEPSGLLNIFS